MRGDHCPEGMPAWEEPLRQQLTVEQVSLLWGPPRFGHKGQKQFEFQPAREAEAEVFLAFGVLESGRGEAGTGQGDPPLRGPKVSS